MRPTFPVLTLAALIIAFPLSIYAGVSTEKNHDFVPKVHNVIFLFDVSDSMTAGHPQNFDHSRLFVATRAFALFTALMPPIPRWQYDVNTALITFGDSDSPKILSPLGPWTPGKYEPFYPCLREEKWFPRRTAALQDALQVAGSLIGHACGRTAVVIFTDGGSIGECPQKTATCLLYTSPSPRDS